MKKKSISGLLKKLQHAQDENIRSLNKALSKSYIHGGYNYNSTCSGGTNSSCYNYSCSTTSNISCTNHFCQ